MISMILLKALLSLSLLTHPDQNELKFPFQVIQNRTKNR